MGSLPLVARSRLLLPAPALAQSGHGFTPIECPMPIPAGVPITCGTYQMPENRSNAHSRMIRMPFAIVHSQSSTPRPDPVVFVSSGGPGGSSLDVLGAYTRSAYLQERDFIFVEQRGNRYAQPALECPEVPLAAFANFSTLDPREVEIAREVEAARACRGRLLAQGVDLTAYNSAESAADLEDLRQLLGYSQWNLMGASYSARLVLATMSRYPEGIRAVVLDSIYAPEVNAYEQRVPTLARALETLFANCAADVECGTAYPDLEPHFYAVLERVNREPLTVEVRHPVTDEAVTLRLLGDDLILGIFNALYQRNTIRFLPFIIAELYRGNTDVVAPVAQEGFRNIFSRAQGMYYSAECREEFPFNDRARQAEIASQYPALANFLPSVSEPDICAIWGAGVADARDNQAVRSQIPALVLAGEYDPVTSPRYTALAADNLPNRFFYQVPYFGHSVQDQSNCANQLAADFMRVPTREPDTTCLHNLSQLDFVTAGADVIATQLLYRLNRTILQRGNPLLIVVVALCLVGLTFQLGAVVVGIRKGSLRPETGIGWDRARQRKSELLVFFPSLTAILHLAALFWLYRLVITTDSTLLGFGLPASARPLIGLWAVAGVCGLFSIVGLMRRCSVPSMASTGAVLILQLLSWSVI